MRVWTTVAASLALVAGSASAQIYDSGGFEGFTLGDLPGQGGWFDDTVGGYSPAQVMLDPTGAGMGNVVMLDPPGTAGGWQGIAINLGLLTGNAVIVQWDQYRTDLNDNVWMADTVAFDNWWAIQWDTSLGIHAETFGPSVGLQAGIWQHITYTFDFAAGLVTVDVDGASVSGSLAAGAIHGWVFEYEPGDFAGEGGPFYIDNFVVTQVPAPGALGLIGLGVLAGVRRRR